MKHLEFIQNVITRMNSNSFLIKGWAITLVSALFALAANGSNIHYVLISYIVIPVFWVLDGFYISIERQYRDLYNNVAQKTEEEIKKRGAKISWLCKISYSFWVRIKSM